MPLHAVQVPVSAPVLVEFIFWPEDDVWKGASQEISRKPKGIWKQLCKSIFSLFCTIKQDGSVNAINEPAYPEFPR